MSDPADRDDAPTTPPPALRPEYVATPISGLRVEPDPSPAPNDTQLSVTEPSGRNPDTLMSLPKPALHGELPFETRLRQLEDRMEAFETRLSAAERQREPLVGGRATPWWFWLLFLLGLAVTWRALEALR
ncbi:MAG TPA: hypothetical protein VGK73_08515 [Polyangiaceae bacterium]